MHLPPPAPDCAVPANYSRRGSGRNTHPAPAEHGNAPQGALQPAGGAHNPHIIPHISRRSSCQLCWITTVHPGSHLTFHPKLAAWRPSGRREAPVISCSGGPAIDRALQQRVRRHTIRAVQPVLTSPMAYKLSTSVRWYHPPSRRRRYVRGGTTGTGSFGCQFPGRAAFHKSSGNAGEQRLGFMADIKERACLRPGFISWSMARATISRAASSPRSSKSGIKRCHPGV